MDYVPITPHDRKVMLEKIGVDSFEDLLAGIPPAIPRARLKLPPGLSEPELLKEAERLARSNATVRSHISFLGAGAYDHLIPSAVRYVAGRGEFLTAYTPYQPEASQGTLQAMYEYQSLLCDVTGMEAANASLYDGASALAEACVLALRLTQRNKLAVSAAVHPEYRETVETYLKHSGGSLLSIPRRGGATDLEAARGLIDAQTAAVVVQMPNALGCLEPVHELAQRAHEAGALFIAAVNPISLGLLAPPGAYGADVVVGEGQPLGNDLNFGGPYLGLFACRQDLLRKIPGRIVGMTRDGHGRRGFVLTLQTREQHIRRSKATSNICTNEAMMALAACAYLAALGKEGFKEVARQSALKAHYTRDRLIQLKGVQPLFPEPFFNEFALSLPVDPELVNQKLLDEGFLGGLALKRWDPALKSGWLVSVTESRTREEIDRFVETVWKLIR